jgi:hypothetical protein
MMGREVIIRIVCREKVKGHLSDIMTACFMRGYGTTPGGRADSQENTYLLDITHHLSIPTELGELEIITIMQMILTRMQ